MSTPVPELVEELADRIAIIKAGRIAAYDTLAELRRNAGSSHRLDEIYQRVASPESTKGIDSYFAERC
jgi:ABC-type multidrug transport system ATPase subunit